MVFLRFLIKNLLHLQINLLQAVVLNLCLCNNLQMNFINQLLKKLKVYSSFKDNIWGVDLADMQLISKYNKGIRYLLCTIDLFSKYA